MYLHLISSIVFLCINCIIMSWGKCEKDYVLNCDSYEDIQSLTNPTEENFINVSPKDDKTLFVCDTPFFENFTSVFDMTLRNVLLVTKDCFRGLDSLKSIDLAANKMTTIDLESFRTSEKMALKALYLSNNYIVTIDFDDIVLPELVQFEIGSNRIRSVSVSSQNLPTIQNMYFPENFIGKVSIESKSLKKLDLSNNRIKVINQNDLIIPQVTILYLNDNLLRIVTSDMFNKALSLEQLFLAHNFIHAAHFPQLKNANYIDLRYNNIKSLMNINLTTFGQEYSLLFDKNKVYELELISEYDKLISFTCFYCYIHFIDSKFFAESFHALQYLQLGGNYLTTATIFEASKAIKLISVDLSSNEISIIKRNDLVNLEKLKWLTISNNQLSTIEPHSFDQLENLESLDLSNNFLFTIEMGLFDKTAALDVLWLTGNNMPYFPIPGWNGITNEVDKNFQHTLTHLNTLGLYKNPLQCSCLDLLLSWTNELNINLPRDERVKKGERPICIVTTQNCKKNINANFSSNYWHLFNEHKIIRN